MRIDEAIKHLLEKEHPRFEGRQMSKYGIAKMIGVTPVMIDRWLNREHNGISDKVVNNFKTVFDIELTEYQSVMYIEDGVLKTRLK